ncbi:GntR family transcriptional regulator [Propionibacteriaceae bacterium Y2011]|uniref:GntR family transcriptional regulator n=1 Tax=Microlunatus sp. Y2014 TaxID=3418488 RepID=UPI003B4E5830
MAVHFAKERLADQVHRVLRDRILSHELGPGHRLSVPALALEFGLSRSPVREAVQRLVTDGLAEERPNQGATVATMDLAELADMYEVRAPLDGLAARLVTGREVPGLGEELASALDLHRRALAAGDVSDIITADLDFHGAIARSCGNAAVWAVLEPIHRRVAVAILAGEPLVWPADALVEHEAIVAAIASRDPDAARQAAEDHIMLARDRICGKLAEARAARD